mgnify:FL=1
MEKWRVKLPEKPTHIKCLVTMQPKGTHPRYVTTGWVDEQRMMDGAVAWMPYPKHVVDDSEGWSSIYRGDDEPSKDGWCLICYDRYNWLIDRLYYDTKQSRFLGAPGTRGDIIAWRPMPKPYTGLGWPRE